MLPAARWTPATSSCFKSKGQPPDTSARCGPSTSAAPNCRRRVPAVQGQARTLRLPLYLVPRQRGWSIPDNISLLPLLSYSPEHNPVENVWEYLRQNQLSLRVWPGYGAIVETCCQAWKALIAMPERIASIARREWANPVTI